MAVSKALEDGKRISARHASKLSEGILTIDHGCVTQKQEFSCAEAYGWLYRPQSVAGDVCCGIEGMAVHFPPVVAMHQGNVARGCRTLLKLQDNQK